MSRGKNEELTSGHAVGVKIRPDLWVRVKVYAVKNNNQSPSTIVSDALQYYMDAIDAAEREAREAEERKTQQKKGPAAAAQRK